MPVSEAGRNLSAAESKLSVSRNHLMNASEDISTCLAEVLTCMQHVQALFGGITAQLGAAETNYADAERGIQAADLSPEDQDVQLIQADTTLSGEYIESCNGAARKGQVALSGINGVSDHSQLKAGLTTVMEVLISLLDEDHLDGAIKSTGFAAESIQAYRRSHGM